MTAEVRQCHQGHSAALHQPPGEGGPGPVIRLMQFPPGIWAVPEAPGATMGPDFSVSNGSSPSQQAPAHWPPGLGRYARGSSSGHTADKWLLIKLRGRGAPRREASNCQLRPCLEARERGHTPVMHGPSESQVPQPR